MRVHHSAAAKSFFQTFSWEIFRQWRPHAQQCQRNESNRESASESACYSFITKHGALAAFWVQGQLIVLQLKSLFYLPLQSLHTHRLTDKQQPIISPNWDEEVSNELSPSSTLNVSLQGTWHQKSNFSHLGLWLSLTSKLLDEYAAVLSSGWMTGQKVKHGQQADDIQYSLTWKTEDNNCS